MSDTIDWRLLWRLATDRFALGVVSLHGPHHWRRVEQNGLQLAEQSGADLTVVRLFAVLHDSCRQNESYDPEHGQRAADWAVELRSAHLPIDGSRFETLTDALIRHDKGQTSPDATIGTCWDADRLDLPRVGMRPDAAYMSTAAGKALAGKGWPFVR